MTIFCYDITMKTIIFALFIAQISLMAQNIDGKWQLKEADAKAYITFDEATHKVSGFSGCNRFSARYSTYEGGVAFGHFALTRKMCPKEVMQSEHRFMIALSQAKLYTVEDGIFTLLDANKKALMQFHQ